MLILLLKLIQIRHCLDFVKKKKVNFTTFEMLKYWRSSENLTRYRWHFWKLLSIKKIGGNGTFFRENWCLVCLWYRITFLDKEVCMNLLTCVPNVFKTLQHTLTSYKIFHALWVYSVVARPLGGGLGSLLGGCLRAVDQIPSSALCGWTLKNRRLLRYRALINVQMYRG